MKLNVKEAEAFVSVVNTLIEKYCGKYPDEYNFDDMAIGYDDEGNVISNNGDDIIDVLNWVNGEIIPNLIK